MLRLIAQKLLKLQASNLKPQTFFYELSLGALRLAGFRSFFEEGGDGEF